MKRVLLTGFERFGAYKNNPSEVILPYLKYKGILGYDIQTLVLPIAIATNENEDSFGKMLVRYAFGEGMDAIVSLNQKSTVSGIQLESSATNWVHSKKFMHPEDNNRVVIPDDHYPAHHILKNENEGFDYAEFTHRCSQKRIPFTPISTDAGTFCGNALMYSILHAKASLGVSIPFSFFHVPCTRSSVAGLENVDPDKFFMTEEHLIEGIKCILRSLK